MTKVAAFGDAELGAAATRLYEEFSRRGLMLVCAESCSGGLVAAAITDIPGSSGVLWGGVVSYSNECKVKLLGVKPESLAAHGAVSREVAAEMAEGALAVSAAQAGRGADIALAITGIAGPEGGSPTKPVGTVWFAWRGRDGRGSEELMLFPGDRAAVREAAARHALEGATRLAETFGSV
jgi:competence/damage-inducible protein CinA C-terminal domain